MADRDIDNSPIVPSAGQSLTDAVFERLANLDPHDGMHALREVMDLMSTMPRDKLEELARALIKAELIKDPKVLATIEACLESGSSEKSDLQLRAALAKALVDVELVEEEVKAPSIEGLAFRRSALEDLDLTQLPQEKWGSSSSLPEIDGLDAPALPTRTLAEVFGEALQSLADSAREADKKHHDSEDRDDDTNGAGTPRELEQSIEAIENTFPELTTVLDHIRNLPQSAFGLKEIPWPMVLEMLEEVGSDSLLQAAL